MPARWLCSGLPLSQKEVDALWHCVLSHTRADDQDVSIRCLSREEMQALNKQYRRQDTPTNVLTFSYGRGVHDIALCSEIAEQEAALRNTSLRDYLALLVVHAFLHSVGMDHERSAQEALITEKIEHSTLRSQGFTPAALARHS